MHRITNVRSRGDPTEHDVPDKVFVIPYRNREPHRAVVMSMLPDLLEGHNYMVLFVHQRDKRPFNRGAIKNLGFLHVKGSYPRNYQNITLVFHDIDYLAYRKHQFSYDTTRGTVNHFFGYPKSLGGIFAIKAGDFERIGGFPNFWTWGREDNMLYERAMRARLSTNYSEFVHGRDGINSMVALWHGWDRLVSMKTIKQYTQYTSSGHADISNVSSSKEKLAPRFYMIHVDRFTTSNTARAGLTDARVMNARVCDGQAHPVRGARGRKRFGIMFT